METRKEKMLRLWKARQEAEGYDVSGVKTLEEAERFFDKKEQTPSQSRLAPCQLSQGESQEIATQPVAAHNDGENLEVQDVPDEVQDIPDAVPEIPDEVQDIPDTVPEIPDEDEETEDEQCDIDSVDEPV